MKLILSTAPTSDRAINTAISEIKNLVSNNEKVFIIVSDRASLITELAVLEKLNLKGIFNLQVLTINSLANRYSSSAKNTLSSFAAQLLIRKILTDNKEKLVCFNKMSGNINFAGELYKTIAQLKSSGITDTEIQTSLASLPYGLKLKMQDIALIYKEYEKIIQAEFSDGFSRLSGLANDIKFNEEIKQATFVFLHFDNITNQIFNIVGEIIKNAKTVIYALPLPNQAQKNTDIYNNYLYNTLKEFAIHNGISCEEKGIIDSTDIEKMLFAFNLGAKKQPTDNIQLYSCSDIETEIENVSTCILSKVFSGSKFSDFNLVLCDSEHYIDKIKDIFAQNNVPFFIDEQFSILNHSLSKFILQIVDCFLHNFQSDSVLNLCKNFYFTNDLFDISAFENYVFKYGIEGAMFFNDFSNKEANNVRKKLQPIFEEYRQFIKAQNADEFIHCIYRLFDSFNIEDQTIQLIQQLIHANDMQTVKISEQIIDKVKEVLNEIKIILRDSKCSLIEFKMLLVAGLKTKNISLVPLKTNSVFVGDLSASYFSAGKTNIVIGAKLGNFPLSVKDVGIISDEELALFNYKNKLEPTVSELNRRAIFKAFEICCMAQGLVVSYSKNILGEDCGKSLTAIDLENIYNVREEQISSVNAINETINQNFISKRKLEKLFYKDYVKDLNNQNIADFNSLKLIKTIIKTDEKRSQNKFKKICNQLNSNAIAVTRLERYFECPFKHFITYGLRLKDREQGIIRAIDIGNIYHDFVYRFGLTLDTINKENLKRKALSIFEKIMRDPKYSVVNEVQLNKPIIKNIEKEIVKIAETLYVYKQDSLFQIKYLEAEFGEGKILKSPVLKCGSRNYYFKGKIDRADTCGDLARVIDYKTGGDKFKLKDIFYGKKIQLISYLMSLKESGFVPTGAYYLPLTYKKTRTKTVARLDGITFKDVGVIKKIDKCIKVGVPSKFVNAKLKNDIEFDGRLGSSTLITEQEINNLLDYVEKLSAMAIEEIANGNILPSPVMESSRVACEYCPYNGNFLCRKANPRKMESVCIENFIAGGVNDGE